MEAVPTPTGTHRIWSILCHISALLGVGFVLPLVVYLAMKGDSDFVRDHAREALNFHISILIYALCCTPLCFIVIGFGLLAIIGIASVILAIVAALKAADNNLYRYPLTLRLVK